jgi:hypothetical protein
MQQQHRQQRPLLGAAKRHRPIALDHLKRPQNSKLDHAPVLLNGHGTATCGATETP